MFEVSPLMKAMARKPHWLYLIDAGNDDLVYTIGYTGRSVEERLAEIKIDYCIPNAIVIRQRRVLGQIQARQIEQELHELCSDCHEYTYSGQEFFELSPERLQQIQPYYDDDEP